jgi:hypothetical protein
VKFKREHKIVTDRFEFCVMSCVLFYFFVCVLFEFCLCRRCRVDLGNGFEIDYSKIAGDVRDPMFQVLFCFFSFRLTKMICRSFITIYVTHKQF